ncbi:MAG TPA: ATP-binding protein [Steroidobacteraceae bacterium]|nr:ATP-binding protein [Steroidobacteraceae bacterium]
MSSIRRRLLYGLLIGIGALLCAAAAAVYAEISDEVDEVFDAQLQQAAYAFSSLPLPSRPQTEGRESADTPLRHLVVEVRDPHSPTPIFHSSIRVSLPASAVPGWSNILIRGRDWRMYGALLAGHYVAVAQPLSVRRQATNEIAAKLLLPLAAALPLAALIVWLGVGRGLLPLQRTAQEVRRRSHADLSPIANAGLPLELTPLVTALNDLMGQLQRTLRAQKDFIADAAHELLTPLTALTLQTQLLARADDAEQRALALSELGAGLARTIHVARQLLTLARQDPDFSAAVADVDLAALVREAVAAHAPTAAAYGIGLHLAGCAPAIVSGDAHGLRILLDNLLDNAVKYTPRGGRVEVHALRGADAAVLRVEDSGAGVPDEQLARIFDRFYRRPGTEVTGSGLGLAIARQVALRHHASLTLRNGGALGGLLAECRLPLAAGG